MEKSPRVPADKEVKSGATRILQRLPEAPANQPSPGADRAGGGQQRPARQSTKPTASPSRKPNVKLVHLICLRPAHDVSGCSGYQSVPLDIFVPAAAPGRHHPMSPRPPLPRSARRQSTLTTLLNTHCHPPPSPQHPLRRPLHPPSLHSILTHRQTSTSSSSPPAMWTRSIPVLIATTPLPHTSAWSVTYDSITRRLANQCLEHQHTPDASASAALTSSAHSPTAWAC
ncbi:hypothetical protein SprV_0100113400 [Sparganum proliferum]